MVNPHRVLKKSKQKCQISNVLLFILQQITNKINYDKELQRSDTKEDYLFLC